ncbi:HNH endonuclease [Aulosira sp. FACHB-615]|uniref:HNH endonuclease n=1 Tax=Aulosira sp. FACHB-615 TaxID=2692777 RepID=UPI0016833ACF|nr:HNH endonuclease [Aulosira sp. FACHB-615]MBD2491687.1 hypothetical protein [Aulosira sp. FACHB-615]
MSFYCLYCNRIRSGKKKSEEEKTKEHFVPKSIGGGRAWHIPVCKNCNRLLGGTYDDELHRLSWMFEFYKSRCIKRVGRAILQNGQLVDVNFSYQEILSNKNIDFQLKCHALDSGKEIPQINIEKIEFELENKKTVIKSYPSILKIALGGAHYLNTRYKLTDKTFFSDLAFAKIREAILGKGNFNPGGNGISSPVVCELLSHKESENIIRRRTTGENKLRHIISLEQENINLVINICLFSFFFWRVIIPMNNDLKITRCEEKFILYELRETTRLITSSMMQHESPIKIVIIINNF